MADDRLFIISCALDRYEVPFDKMPALKSVPEADRSAFALDEDGSYIHWPGPDIHVDLDAIRAAIDPEWRAKALTAKTTPDRRYGAAIAKLRLARGLKQSDIAGLSERQVRRIEKGKGTTSESLHRLAAAHGMDMSAYLREVAKIVRAPRRNLASQARTQVQLRRAPELMKLNRREKKLVESVDRGERRSVRGLKRERKRHAQARSRNVSAVSGLATTHAETPSSSPSAAEAR